MYNVRNMIAILSKKLRFGGLVCFFYSSLLKKILILALKVQHICYKLGLQTEEFNDFGHYHRNVTRQAQEISWVIFLFLFSKHSTGDSFSKFRYVPGTRICLFKSDLPPCSPWHHCTKIYIPPLAEEYPSKQYFLKTNHLIL